jgi:putative transposase
MSYPTDLTDEQWAVIEPIFKLMIGNYGNRSKWSKRELINAVQYLTKTGCQWTMLPKDFPPHNTVWSFFRRARDNGTWQLINAELVALSRLQAGKKADPTYSLIDSQSTKTTSAAEERGIDGGKKS